MNRIPELDGVRALAIALVIGCHYPVFAVLLGRAPQFGWAGVEIFFVLSGYLITTNLLALRGRPRAYRTFYARRVRRIFPPYFIAIALCAAFSMAFTFHLNGRLLLLQAGFLTSFEHSRELLLASLHALRAHTVPSLFAAPPLPPGLDGVSLHNLKSALSATWSLSVEEWFYILWAPAVLAFGRRGILAGSITALVLGSFLRWTSGAAGLLWYMDFFCRFDLLGIGALLALWLNLRKCLPAARQRRYDRLLAALSVTALLALVALLFHIRPFLGREIRDSALFAAFGTTLIGLTVAGVVVHLIHSSGGRSPLARFFRLPPLVWIGRRSYTIYLAHLPWFWVVCAFLGVAGRPSWPAALLSLAFTVLTAAFSWRYIEEPLLRPKSPRLVPVPA